MGSCISFLLYNTLYTKMKKTEGRQNEKDDKRYKDDLCVDNKEQKKL